MRRGFLCLLCCSFSVLAQPPSASPIDAAIQEYWTARNAAQFDKAAAKREEARTLLAQTPVSTPQFAGWVQNVSSLYQTAGMPLRARSLVEDALGRAGSLPEGSSVRLVLLNLLASSWQEDRNLLKAVGYLEKAIAEHEAALSAGPPAPAPDVVQGSRIAIFGSGVGGRFLSGGPALSLASTYQRLSDLYLQVGRPDAAAAVVGKIKALSNDPYSLANLYERQGKMDEAAALYQDAVTQTGNDPVKKAGALHQLAFLYQRQQRFGDAAAVLEQAATVVEASSDPNTRNQSMGIRQNLANALQQSGQTQKADQVYQQMLAAAQGQNRNYEQALMGYAGYLNSSKRAEQAESLLKDYLDSHPQMEPWQQSNMLFTMAASARQSDNPARAEEYQRAAEAKSHPDGVPPAPERLLMDLMKKAQSALMNDNPGEALSLGLQAMEFASRSADRDQVGWQIPSLANNLASKHATAQADQLYQQLFAVAEGWSTETLQPLVNTAMSYPRFLMMQKDRAASVPQAIDRLRAILVMARGPETGMTADVHHMTIDYERTYGSKKRAIMVAQDLLAMQEGLSGPTGAPVMDALVTLAGVYEANGDYAHALPVERHAVAISDLVLPANNPRRSQLRMQVALNLAHQGQFDDADSAAAEAMEVAKLALPQGQGALKQQLEQLKRLKTPPKDESKEAPKDAHPVAPVPELHVGVGGSHQ